MTPHERRQSTWSLDFGGLQTDRANPESRESAAVVPKNPARAQTDGQTDYRYGLSSEVGSLVNETGEDDGATG